MSMSLERRNERFRMWLCRQCPNRRRRGKVTCADCAARDKVRLGTEPLPAAQEKIPDSRGTDGDTGLSRERLGAAACGMLAEPECPRCKLHGKHECINIESYMSAPSLLARAADR